MALTKTALIRSISNTIAVSRKQAARNVESLVKVVMRTLASGEPIRIRGFGRFYVKEKPARTGRHPATGKSLRLAPCRSVAFKCSPQLRQKLNARPAEADGLPEVPPLGIDRRSEPRRRVTGGTATVRVAGLPVVQFPMQDISANGTCFLVEADAAILRNLHVGQQIDIRFRLPRIGETEVFQKAQVMHITPAAEPSQRGFFRLGVRILSTLVFRS